MCREKQSTAGRSEIKFRNALTPFTQETWSQALMSYLVVNRPIWESKREHKIELKITVYV